MSIPCLAHLLGSHNHLELPKACRVLMGMHKSGLKDVHTGQVSQLSGQGSMGSSGRTEAPHPLMRLLAGIQDCRRVLILVSTI